MLIISKNTNIRFGSRSGEQISYIIFLDPEISHIKYWAIFFWAAEPFNPTVLTPQSANSRREVDYFISSD